MSKLLKIPLLGTSLKKMDSIIETHGIQLGVRKLMLLACPNFIVTIENEHTREILNQKPVIVAFANHISEFDPFFVLAALSEREDVHIVMDSRYQNISKSFDRHVIPVYISNNESEEGERALSALKIWFFRKFHSFSKIDPQKEHELNVKSIKTAAKKIDSGELVIISPGGAREWYSGIGHLIKDVENKEDSYLVKAHIKGATKLDMLRLIPFLSLFLPKVEIIFSAPQKLSEFEGQEGKNISNTIKGGYYNWFHGKKSLGKTLFKQNANKFTHTICHFRKILEVCVFAH